MCPCDKGNQPCTTLYQQKCQQQVKGSDPSPSLGTGETLLGTSGVLCPVLDSPGQKEDMDILGQVQQVLKGAGAQEMKAKIEEPVLEEEKVEVEILLLSTKTCWTNIKITEPDTSQKCTVKGQHAIGRSCNTGNSDLV